MFSLIKKVFIVLLSFSSSLARDRTKYHVCMIMPPLIDLNPVELKYYPFMISLDKCNESCNDLPPKKMCSEKKDINVKVFDMITNKNEAKTNCTICNSNQK